MDAFYLAVGLLPEHLKDLAAGLKDKPVEEFRLRVGQLPTALIRGTELPISEKTISVENLMRCLEKATNASIHTAAKALCRGYICYRGLRIGVCGTGAFRSGEITGFSTYSSLAIRIPGEIKGGCDAAYQKLYSDGIENSLIIAPPGTGKTTALRELVRKLSNSGIRVGLIDERNEIAAYDMGQAQFDTGRHTDILTGISKAEAAIMLLRGMNPQLVAMDEITKNEDLEAISELYGCGIKLLATAHASDVEDMMKRRIYQRLLESGIFSSILIVSLNQNGRSYRVNRICT